MFRGITYQFSSTWVDVIFFYALANDGRILKDDSTEHSIEKRNVRHEKNG